MTPANVTKSQLGSEDLWCLFGTSKAFRHCVAPMLLRKARIRFTWTVGFTGIDPDRVSLNGRTLHPRVAHDILATWASSVQILKYDLDVTFQTIDLLPRLVNMKYFRYAKSFNALLWVKMHGNQPSNREQY
jgi:hypothetical protein